MLRGPKNTFKTIFDLRTQMGLAEARNPPGHKNRDFLEAPKIRQRHVPVTVSAPQCFFIEKSGELRIFSFQKKTAALPELGSLDSSGRECIIVPLGIPFFPHTSQWQVPCRNGTPRWEERLVFVPHIFQLTPNRSFR